MAIPIAMIVIGKLSIVWGGGGGGGGGGGRRVGGTPNKILGWELVLPESLACDDSLEPLTLHHTTAQTL